MRRRATFAVLTAASAAVLAGCAHPLVVDPAPYAADPDCAEVMLAIPDIVGGLDQRGTTSQATQAWGEEFPIVARCGVEPPGPTTEPCLAIATASANVDWLVEETEEDWVAVTFGRSPALELTVPKVRADDAVSEVLSAVSTAAARAPVNNLECR
ncbi:DUF3515 family protein [Demequina globuliformis]|uniref:DUF3515 family protein n=1 Tax=Demequina globuliformis TaxID=676202 RepID=UPI0007814C11|nr:DUF3515 family protein [Demequina globuliformis]